MNVSENEADLVLDMGHLKREFVAGGIAGSIGIIVGFPFDLVKVNLQCYPEKYKTPMQCLRLTLQEGGFRALYRGCIPPIITQAFINSLLFMGESTAMKILQPELKRGEVGTPLNTYLAGCFGAVAECIVLVPADVVKCTMQAQSNAPTSQNILAQTVNCVKNIHKSEGIRGFFKGWNITLAREVPSIGFYFFAYKHSRDQITKLQGRKEPSTFATLISGGFAGAVSWAVIYPTDVVKTYMQISTVPEAGNALAYKDMSMLAVSKSLYRQHGMKVFFRGLGTTVLRAFPVNAVTFYFYELIKDKLHYT